MDFQRLVYLLAQGFVVGAGPCLLICGPLILPYIAGTKRSWQEGLHATLIFSLTRLAVYVVLGALSGLIGAFMLAIFLGTPFAYHVWTAGAFIIISLGILIILGRGFNLGFCRGICGHTLDNSVPSMVFLGLLIGFSPCLPLIAVMIEIALFSGNMLVGGIYGFTFGIGTVLSPLLIIGALTPVLPAGILRSDRAVRIFSIICGALLIIVGLYVLRARL